MRALRSRPESRARRRATPRGARTTRSVRDVDPIRISASAICNQTSVCALRHTTGVSIDTVTGVGPHRGWSGLRLRRRILRPGAPVPAAVATGTGTVNFVRTYLVAVAPSKAADLADLADAVLHGRSSLLLTPTVCRCSCQHERIRRLCLSRPTHNGCPRRHGRGGVVRHGRMVLFLDCGVHRTVVPSGVRLQEQRGRTMDPKPESTTLHSLQTAGVLEAVDLGHRAEPHGEPASSENRQRR